MIWNSARCQQDIPLQWLAGSTGKKPKTPWRRSLRALDQQILLCGLLLTLQLLDGAGFASRLYEDKCHKVQIIDLTQLEKEITAHLPDASKIFDAIEQDYLRKAGPRVEELLKKTLFYLLKAAQKVATRVKQDSEMAAVEI